MIDPLAGMNQGGINEQTTETGAVKESEEAGAVREETEAVAPAADQAGQEVEAAGETEIAGTPEQMTLFQRGFTESAEPTAEEQEDANSQYDEVVEKYKGTPLWMKAPNGMPTKLTERQWVQVRTKNFKRWFGDWEKAGIRERLEKQRLVLVEKYYAIENPRDRKKIAIELVEKQFTVKKSIGTVSVSKTSMRNSFSHGTSDEKLDVVRNIRELLEKAEYLGSAKDFDGKEINNYYLATKIWHDGKSKLVFFRVRERSAGSRQLYVHDVYLEDDIKEKAGTRQTSGGVKDAVNARGPSLYRAMLQDIYAADNASVSKIVDENGEPLVVYHGTIADFDTFRPSESRKTQGTGMWFGPSHIAGTYTGRYESKGSIMPVFLNAKNPAVANAKRSFWDELGEDISIREYGKKRGTTLAKLFGFSRNDYATTDDIARYAYEHGYDGVIFDNVRDVGPTKDLTTDESYRPASIYSVAFPGQIKSAIGNKGTFSSSPNILYQENGDSSASAVPSHETARGATTFTENGLLIELFKDADFSTFAHETAHFILQNFAGLAQLETASQYAKEEFRTICEFLGAVPDANGNVKFTVERHEKSARPVFRPSGFPSVLRAFQRRAGINF